MRVLLATHTAALSGGELALLNLVTAMSQHDPGVEFLVVAAAEGPLTAAFRAVGVEVTLIPLSDAGRTHSRFATGLGIRNLRAAAALVLWAARLRRLVRRERPDIVHSNSIKSGFAAGFATLGRRTPLVWHLRDNLNAEYMGARSALLVRSAIRIVADIVVCDSEQVARRSRIPSRKTAVVPSGVDLTTFTPPTARSDGAPLRLGLVGRLAPWKGQHLAIEALRTLLDTDWRLVVVGAALFGEDDYATAVSRSAEADLPGRVVFTGQVTDVAEQLRTFDILMHTSLIAEPFGQVVLEGMATAVAVVAADSGGPVDMITDGESGLLYKTGDAAALADVLRTVIDDRDLRMRLGEGGRRAAEGFDVNACATRMLGVYARLID